MSSEGPVATGHLTGPTLTDRPEGENPIQALVAVLVPGDDEVEDLAGRWLLRAELVRRYPSLVPVHLAGLAKVEQVLIEALAERLGTDTPGDPYPTVVVTAAVAVFRSTLAWWHGNDQPRPLADALRENLGALATGMSTPPAGRRTP